MFSLIQAKNIVISLYNIPEKSILIFNSQTTSPRLAIALEAIRQTCLVCLCQGSVGQLKIFYHWCFEVSLIILLGKNDFPICFRANISRKVIFIDAPSILCLVDIFLPIFLFKSFSYRYGHPQSFSGD